MLFVFFVNCYIREVVYYVKVQIGLVDPNCLPMNSIGISMS